MSDKEKPKCSNGVVAFSLFFGIFMFGAIVGLILYLTDGGGGTTTNVPNTPSASSSSNTVQSCDPGFWGGNCTTCSTCGLHGSCNGSGTTFGTGTCICGPGFAGVDCATCSINYWGPNCVKCDSCSGHGTCDGSGTTSGTGSCICDASDTTSFDGAQCNTCSPGFYGASCTKCTAACGTHGKCSDGVDGDGSCKCDLGWSDATCSTCDSTIAWSSPADTSCILGPGLDPGTTGVIVGVACNGHGTLNLLTGACSCDTGYGGQGCTKETCPFNKYGPSCAACQCNGHGFCDGSGTKSGTGGCRCTGNYAGATCTSCKRGFTGSDCNTQCKKNGVTNNICSKHGKCNDDGVMVTNGQSGRCTCDSGYTNGADNACENGVAPGACVTNTGTSEVCHGRGTCNGDGTNTVCTCTTEGYDPSTMCSTLFIGWAIKGGVVSECPGGASNPCSGRGSCSITTGECACDDGYSGIDCAGCAYGHYVSGGGGGGGGVLTCAACPGRSVDGVTGDVTVCSGHGACGATNGACTCASGWSGTDCDTCAAGFWGASCWSCPRSSGTSLACSGHGTCDGDGTTIGTGACVCTDSATYSGQACGTCQAGRYGAKCSECKKDSNGYICSARGSCDGDGTLHGDGTCRCLAGSTGTLCELCIKNHYGSSCTSCPGLTEEGQACSGHGICSGEGTRQGAGTCTCTTGWEGDTCDAPSACSILNDCNGQGTCDSGTCFCSIGWMGTTCETEVLNPTTSCGSECNGLNERCTNGICTNVAPPTDPCATQTCSNGHGLCVESNCVCAPTWEGKECQTSRGSNVHQWSATKWTTCTEGCGTGGTKERVVTCVDVSTGARTSDAICVTSFGPAPLSFEQCHRFPCSSIVGVGGIQIAMQHQYVNVTALHLSTFEDAVGRELADAVAVPHSRIDVVSSQHGSDGNGVDLILIRFLVLPPVGDDEIDINEIIQRFEDQTSDPTSKLRTEGSFVRRVVPTDGAMNVVLVTVEESSATTTGTEMKSIEDVNPFMDVVAADGGMNTFTPSDGSSSPGLNHGGIAGVIVACSFLGIGAIVGAVWFTVHRTSAGTAYKQRSSKRKTSMKIQLTEAEKTEMGMVTNPNVTNAKTQEAISMVQAAVAQDEQRNYAEAIDLYNGAVQRFKEVMSYEKNPQYKFSLAKKMDKYMTRVKELKQISKEQGGPGRRGSGGPGRGGGGDGGRGGGRSGGRGRGGGMVRAPASGGQKSGGLVRAPQVVTKGARR